MGNRLHVAKKYEVQYATYERFNWQVHELHKLLSVLDIAYSGDEFDEDFEVTKDEWQKGINTLRCLEILHDQNKKQEINDALNELDLTAEEVIEIFETYYEYSDPNSTELHFAFF